MVKSLFLELFQFATFRQEVCELFDRRWLAPDKEQKQQRVITKVGMLLTFGSACFGKRELEVFEQVWGFVLRCVVL